MLKRTDVAELFKSIGVENVPTDEEQNNKQRKELRKLLDSYLSVAEHMFGRPPSTEEMIGLLSEAAKKPEAEQEAEKLEKPEEEKKITFSHNQTPMKDLQKAEQDEQPSDHPIFNTKVFYGRNEKMQPDPKKVLFYEHANGGVYNVPDSKWEEDRPHVLDHLDSRPVMYNELDLNNYILHGMLSPEEYEGISDLLPENCHKMWDLQKKIKESSDMLIEESMHQSDMHAQVLEITHDLRDLLSIIEHLKEKEQAMLSVLKSHGLGSEFFEQEDSASATSPIDHSQYMSGLHPDVYKSLRKNT
jgi:hypothetical protein